MCQTQGFMNTYQRVGKFPVLGTLCYISMRPISSRSDRGIFFFFGKIRFDVNDTACCRTESEVLCVSSSSQFSEFCPSCTPANPPSQRYAWIFHVLAIVFDAFVCLISSYHLIRLKIRCAGSVFEFNMICILLNAMPACVFCLNREFALTLIKPFFN